MQRKSFSKFDALQKKNLANVRNGDSVEVNVNVIYFLYYSPRPPRPPRPPPLFRFSFSVTKNSQFPSRYSIFVISLYHFPPDCPIPPTLLPFFAICGRRRAHSVQFVFPVGQTGSACPFALMLIDLLMRLSAGAGGGEGVPLVQ